MARASEVTSTPTVVPLGPFDLIEPVGSGGMATVWRANHRRQGSPVAVKVITSELARLPEHQQAFRNEVRSVAGLEHPNIIVVYDLGEISPLVQERSGGVLGAGSPYLVMEYIASGTLSSAFPLKSWQALRRVLLALLDALAHAHAHDVIHLDIKPDNVLIRGIDRDFALKLTDFGIAHAFDRLILANQVGAGWKKSVGGRDASTVVGTPDYMAPEQFVGDWRSYGPWTDLYALGCLAFEMVTGAPPFSNTSLSAQAKAHWYENVPEIDGRLRVPEGFNEWIMRLLEKEPARRYQRAADAAWALLRLTTRRRIGSDSFDSEHWSKARTRLYSRPVFPAGLKTGNLALEEDPDLPAEVTRLDGEVGSRESGVSLEDLSPTGLLAACNTLRFNVEPLEAEPLELSGLEGVEVSGDLPPLPRSWRYRNPSSTPLQLEGVGLGLYGLRSIPMVDREEEREFLWQLLHEVSSSGEARCVFLRGPIGSGKSRLAKWFSVRAHEVGAAAVLKAVHSPGGGPTEGIAAMLARHLRCVGLEPGQVRGRIRHTLASRSEGDAQDWEDLATLLMPEETASSSESTYSRETAGRGSPTPVRQAVDHESTPGSREAVGPQIAAPPWESASPNGASPAREDGGPNGSAPLGNDGRGDSTPALGNDDADDSSTRATVGPTRASYSVGRGRSTESTVYQKSPARPIQTEPNSVFRRAIERLAEERPMIIWLEDAQWGLESLAFVVHLLYAQSIRATRVLFLITMQDEVLSECPEEARLLERLVKLEGVFNLNVGPLCTEDHLELVRRLLGLSESLAEEVVRRTRGAPLFAVQLVRDWVQRDMLEVSDGRFVLAEGVSPELPDDLHEVWMSRIRRLMRDRGAGALESMELAAILGGSVDQVEWRQACSVAGIPVPAGLLGLLEAHQLIHFRNAGTPGDRSVSGAWTFLHSMLRESLVRSAREGDRYLSHQRACAEALEKLYPSRRKETAVRLGRHYFEAHMYEAAMPPLLEAARMAEQQAEYSRAQAALNLWTSAIRALSPPESDSRWADGWLIRVSILQLEGNLSEALTLARRIEAWAGRYKLPEMRARATMYIGAILEKLGDVQEAFELDRKGFGLFEKLGDKRGMASCLRGMVSCAVEAGRFINADQLLHRARELYRQCDDPVGEADCDVSLGEGARSKGEDRRANRCYERARRLYARTGDQRGVGEAIRGLGLVALRKHDSSSARKHLQEASAIFERIGAPIEVGNCLNGLGDVERMEGNMAGAVRSYRRAIEIFEASRYVGALLARYNFALSYLADQQYDKAELILESCISALEDSGRKALLHSVHCGLLACAGARNDWKAWDTHLPMARKVTGNVGVDEDDLWPVQRAGDLAFGAGELRRALEAYTLAKTIRQRVEAVG